MSYYLLENHVNLPNGKLPWYTTRRTCRHGIQGAHVLVAHTPETLEDFNPPDMAAERVAQYGASTTRASWHVTTDSDSIIPMLPWDYTAWHVRGYNRCAVGIELGASHDSWAISPQWWDDATLQNAAIAAKEGCDFHGIPYRKINRAAVDRGEYGIIGHNELDPSRRSDPGPEFDWDQFLALMKGDAMALPKEVEKFVVEMYNGSKAVQGTPNGFWAGPALELIYRERKDPALRESDRAELVGPRGEPLSKGDRIEATVVVKEVN